MAALAIQISQSGAPVTQPGEARQDLVTGLPVQLEAIGGPFSEYLWTFEYRPINIETATRANSAFSAPTSPITLVDPIDVPGTWNVRCSVDSGSGLGATEEDVAVITFYAGQVGNAIFGPLNVDPAELPRRIIAFRERLQHNVPDDVEPTGNTEGWSREWLRWYAVMQRLYEGKSWAHGRVTIAPGGPAAVVNGFNVASATWQSTGLVTILFERQMPDGLYTVIPQARGAAGFATCMVSSGVGFNIERRTTANVLADAEFVFDVKFNPV